MKRRKKADAKRDPTRRGGRDLPVGSPETPSEGGVKRNAPRPRPSPTRKGGSGLGRVGKDARPAVNSVRTPRHAILLSSSLSVVRRLDGFHPREDLLRGGFSPERVRERRPPAALPVPVVHELHHRAERRVLREVFPRAPRVEVEDARRAARGSPRPSPRPPASPPSRPPPLVNRSAEKIVSRRRRRRPNVAPPRVLVERGREPEVHEPDLEVVRLRVRRRVHLKRARVARRGAAA